MRTYPSDYNNSIYTVSNYRRTNIHQRRSKHKRPMQIILFMILIIIVGSCITGFASANSKPTSTHKKYFTSITIEKGDTLWSIANENMTEEYSSVEDYIDEVCEMNHLVDATITEGHHIVIPHYTVD